MKNKLFVLLLFSTISLKAELFVGSSLFVGSAFSSDIQTGAKIYIQSDAYPSLTFIGGYTFFNWIQPGVIYTQGGTDYTIGKDQSLSQNTLSLGIGATLFAKSSWYIDTAVQYILLQKLTFSSPIQDATFPTGGFSAEVGFGYKINAFDIRPYYSFISFFEDYIVLNQTMLELKSQHTFGLELIYWY